MANVVFTVTTDDGTTVNSTHNCSMSDKDLDRFLTAMAATYAPGASNDELITMWVTSNMHRANTFIATYELSQLTVNAVSLDIK